MINSSNFFKRNTSVRNPASPYKKGKFVDESPEYKSRVFSRVQENPVTKTLLSIRKNVFSIENTLKSFFNLDKKKQKTKERFNLIEEQESKRKPKPKYSSSGVFGNIIQRPKTGALDAIKNFITFTFLGWLFTKLQPLVGGLSGLLPLLDGIMGFLSGTVVGIIDVFSSFIKTGYEVKDKITDGYNNVKKESVNIKKTFDDTISSLGELLDSTIKVTTSFLDVFGQAYDNTKITDAKPEGGNIEDFSSLKTFAPTMATPFQSGGSVQQDRIDPKKTPITRGPLQQRRRELPKKKPNIQSQKTAPGKDVGGEDKVKEIYGEKISTFKPDFIPMGVIWGSDEKSGYSALIKSSNEYKKPNADDILGIGNLMGATVDTVLGQKPERRTYTQFADGIRYLVDRGITYPEEFKRIDLEIMLRRIIEPKIEAAIGKIREEVNKKSKVDEFDPRLTGEMQLGGEFDEAMIGAGEMDLLRRMVYAEAGGEGLIGMALVARSIMNRTGLIQSGVVDAGQFHSKGGSITEVITAYRNGRWQYSPMGDGSIRQQLSSSQLDQATKAIELAKNPEKLIESLKNEKLSDFQISRLMASTGFRNYDYAHTDASQQVNEVRFKKHTFNTAGNRSLLVPRNVAIQLGAGAVMVGDGQGVPLRETSQFGWRWGRMHWGIDLQARSGWKDTIHLPVAVKKSGVVVGLTPPTPGKNSAIEIRHPDGVLTRYVHLNQFRVKMGDPIRPGQVIGRIAGENEPGYGNSRGPHLHFEWYPDGKTPRILKTFI
jgi:murein DD-endopeptidase MepM/ murein hydrolase activator NlpD